MRNNTIQKSFFNKIDNVLLLSTLIQKCLLIRSSKVLLPDVVKIRTVSKYRLYCQWTDIANIASLSTDAIHKVASLQTDLTAICRELHYN